MFCDGGLAALVEYFGLAEALPNCFILGAAKAGSTALYEHLVRHPDVYQGVVKEPHFFSNEELYSNGLTFYVERYFKGAKSFLVRIDGTPHYLFYEKAAKRIALDVPVANQRFIVILRDPIERAYSLYWNMIKEGHETRSFEEALMREIEEWGRSGEDDYCGRVRTQYVRSGLYAEQIRRYFEYFDSSRFLFLLDQDLRRDAEKTIRKVLHFLGLEESKYEYRPLKANAASAARLRFLQKWLREPRACKKTVGRLLPYGAKVRIVSTLLKLNSKASNYPKMNSATRQALKERFRKDVLDLEVILGRSLEHWLR